MKIVVLSYCKPEPELFDNMGYKLTGLRNQLMAMKESGYNAITCEILRRYLNEEIDLPDKPVLITFHIGYTTSFEYAKSVLKEVGFTAIFFIIGEWTIRSSCKEPGFMGEYMNIDQLRELHAEGFELGLHGYSQNDFNNLGLVDIARDIDKNIALFKKIDLPHARAFAYPKGFIMSGRNRRKEIRTILTHCNIDLAFQITNKINKSYAINKFEINCIEIDQHEPVKPFLQKVKRGQSNWWWQ